jgi:hypothetical protein
LAKERSASEVILSLEHEVSCLKGMINSIDHNVKLLLSRQNVQLSVPVQQKLHQSPVLARAESATVEAVEFVQVDNGKRVVQERLTYGDSKPIILAQVEIFGMDGKLVDKRKTNNAGKWTSSLPPGKYMIRVAKTATSVKAQVTGQYEINITPGDKPLQLDSRKVGI